MINTIKYIIILSNIIMKIIIYLLYHPNKNNNILIFINIL